MIAKINNGTSLFGALSYNQKKVNEGQARVISGNRMIANMSDDHRLDFHLEMKSFELYLIANQRTEKPVVHISLNPDPKDVLTDALYAELAADYMQKTGFENQPYIVYRHEDIDRHHIHIVTVRVDENGKKISDSFEKRRSMDVCRELEILFGLHPALKKEADVRHDFKKINHERGDVKRQIANVLKSVTENYQFRTPGEYNALLSCFNINMKQVKGEKFGKTFNGVVYSATNDQSEIVSNPFKSSLFGKAFGYEELSKLAAKNAEWKENRSGRAKGIVSAAMKQAKDRTGFVKILQNQGIDVVFRTNETGRIYGVTFIDHQNRVVMNGSGFGKEFSANAFNDLFNGAKKHHPTENKHGDTPHIISENIQNTSIIEEAFGVFNLFDVLLQGEAHDETAFAKKMRKKKKRKPNHT